MKQIKKVQIPGLLLSLGIFLFVSMAVGTLLTHSSDLDLAMIWSDTYYRHITKFSFYQAFLSTLLSIVLAIPISHALSRRTFWGKSFLLKLFATTLVLPVLVAVFGILAIYGNSGLLANLFTYFEAKLPFSIFGLNGILLAHVFFNLPFACRLFLQALNSIPQKQHQLASHLGLKHWNKFRLIEWPYIAGQIPHAAGLIFMLCFTSFAVVMALGGGPKSTTIELAIYQAIKFDFDLQTGALLALWQICLCGTLAIFIQKFSLLISGINPKIWTVIADLGFWLALKNSIIIAVFAGLIAVVFAFFILLASRQWRLVGLNNRADKIEMLATIILVTPGLVISTGLFLLLREFSSFSSLSLYIVIAVNALMALPFTLKSLAVPMLQNAQKYELLCRSLGIFSLYRIYWVEWKSLKYPILQAMSLSFVLSIGDLSAIALFGSHSFSTLPLYLFQLLGSYQLDSAAVVSLVLLILSVGTFMVIESLFNEATPQAKRAKND